MMHKQNISVVFIELVGFFQAAFRKYILVVFCIFVVACNVSTV